MISFLIKKAEMHEVNNNLITANKLTRKFFFLILTLHKNRRDFMMKENR